MKNKDKYFTLNDLAIEYSRLCNRNVYIMYFDAFCFTTITQSKTEYDDIDYFLDDLKNVCDDCLQNIIVMFMIKNMFEEE